MCGYMDWSIFSVNLNKINLYIVWVGDVTNPWRNYKIDVVVNSGVTKWDYNNRTQSGVTTVFIQLTSLMVSVDKLFYYSYTELRWVIPRFKSYTAVVRA